MYINFNEKFQTLKKDYENIHNLSLKDIEFVDRLTKSYETEDYYCSDYEDLIVYISLIANFNPDGSLT
jgi:hypothetical protein